MEFYQKLWNDILDILSKNLSESAFEETFGESKKVAKEENGIVYIVCPSTFVKSKINTLYLRSINEILATLTTKKLRLKFVCEDEIKTKPVIQFTNITTNNLNPQYTFESLVVGESNRFAYLSGMKAAEQPGVFINPLYIFGGVGLGKTHLMQAIGNFIADNDINSKILYVQAKDFIMDYAKATQSKNMAPFYEKYENLDVLLVDDIQMLSIGKISQQEFFTLFNDMVTRQKQIVITSDCPADKLSDIMPRLTSRFQMGVSVDIRQPDLTQRVNILRRKLAESSPKHFSDEILYYIAENFIDNVRELEGALNRFLLYTEMYGEDTPDVQMAKEALDILIKAKKPTVNQNYEDALSVIANTYSITTIDILGNSRNQKYVLPRHIAMYILKTKYNLTYQKIGSILNGRDHTTIMNGCKKIEDEIQTSEQLKMAVETILKKL